MDGMEILSQTEILKHPDFVGIMLICGIIIFLMTIFIIFPIGVYKQSESMMHISIFFLMAVFIMIVFCGLSEPSEPTGKYIYKVTLDDTVSFIEFDENYEVLEQEGKIWTVKEKE